MVEPRAALTPWIPFLAILNKALVSVNTSRENVAPKTHIALLGLAAASGGSVGFTTAAAVHELMEARDDRRLLTLRTGPAQTADHHELGFVPRSTTGAELLRGLHQRYERGSVLVTTNLPYRRVD